MTASRSTRLDRLRRTLSDRDWAILNDLARVRLLSVRHVQRLHLTDGSPLAQARRARAQMQRLHKLGLVKRLGRRVGGVRAGSAGYVYALSIDGQRVTSGAGPTGGRLRTPWEPSVQFVDHVLGVSGLYVSLREDEADGRLTELAFEAEPACWRTGPRSSAAVEVIKPDAFVSFAVGDYEYRYFVEVDRATQSRSVIRRKGEVYVGYFLSGHEQRRHGVFPKVAFVTPTEERREEIVGALSQLDAGYWKLFQVAVGADAFSDALAQKQHEK